MSNEIVYTISSHFLAKIPFFSLSGQLCNRPGEKENYKQQSTYVLEAKNTREPLGDYDRKAFDSKGLEIESDRPP